MVKIKKRKVFSTMLYAKYLKMKNKYNNVFEELEKHRKKDFTFKSGRILGSMCTQPHFVAEKAYKMFLATNLGDPELFQGTKELEKKYILFLKKLLNAPKNSTGIICSGGTESNITAIWLAKNLSNKKEVIIPQSAHFSFEKIKTLMNIKLKTISLTEKYVLNLSELKKKISNNTLVVVGIAGSTELGTIDPIPELSDICYDQNIFLHIDAASGGYIIPFLKKLGYNIPDFDFKLKGVSSISIDAHKMGLAPIPIGTLMIQDKNWLKTISVESHCVSSKTQSGILGTRSGGPVAGAYAVAEYLGFNGYKKIIKKCMKNTEYFTKKIKQIGLKTVIEPTLNVVSIKLKKPNLISKKLAEQGWRVNTMDRISSIRIVLMPHITKKNIDDFLPILEKTCRESDEI